MCIESDYIAIWGPSQASARTASPASRMASVNCQWRECHNSVTCFLRCIFRRLPEVRNNDRTCSFIGKPKVFIPSINCLYGTKAGSLASEAGLRPLIVATVGNSSHYCPTKRSSPPAAMAEVKSKLFKYLSYVHRGLALWIIFTSPELHSILTQPFHQLDSTGGAGGR